jgi:uncharacterized protein
VKRLCFCLTTVLIALLSTSARAAEVIPPKPAHYFNDYAGLISQSTVARLDSQLIQFERDTSTQVVVAIYPKMQSDSDIADYTRRVAQSWGVGQKKQNNGVVLFVFPQDRKMFIQTGYGAEGALPDATAFDITERHIKPHFRTQDYDGGLSEGVDLICKALRGEYKGSGKTVAESNQGNDSGGAGALIFLVVLIIIIIIVVRQQQKHGYRYSGFGGPFVGGWSGSSGGSWSSGGGGGFGGGGFSGGGGSFGGGGAGSSW